MEDYTDDLTEYTLNNSCENEESGIISCESVNL
jgi:hypothetical protein